MNFHEECHGMTSVVLGIIYGGCTRRPSKISLDPFRTSGLLHML